MRYSQHRKVSIEAWFFLLTKFSKNELVPMQERVTIYESVVFKKVCPGNHRLASGTWISGGISQFLELIRVFHWSDLFVQIN
jgi:hypothetical protein